MSANASNKNPLYMFRRLLHSYRITQVIYVAAMLGIADLLKDGPRQCEDLARVTNTHPPSLLRVLRVLASIGVLTMEAPNRFGLTPIGELLRRDVSESQWAWAVYVGGSPVWQVWGDLLHSVQTGETGYQHLYGMSNWEYRAQHPDSNAIFNEAMTANIGLLVQDIVNTYDFASVKRMVDVGGGQGRLVAAVLQTYPHIRGVVFDQPHVVNGARAILEAAGVAERSETVGGDFFVSVPAGADVYLLSHIIHDWDDERAIAILKNCQRALADGGRVLIIEQRIGENAQEALPTLLSDLNMLVMTGGRERTEEEYQSLYAAAGLELTRVIPLEFSRAVFEAHHA